MLPFQSPERRSTRPPLHETLNQSSSTSWDTGASSWDTQTVVGDEEDDDPTSSSNLTQNHHAVSPPRNFLPREVSSKLEPFNAMPIKLDRFAEGLVSFYLLQYPAATYVFNQNLSPHPVYTNFAIAMNAPACFQVILARSALYKKSAGQYGTILERAQLDTAVVEHKTHAIHRIRQLSEMEEAAGSGCKDELVASIISLGTLEMRMGSTDSGGVHYTAVRRLLKSIGGPMHIQDLRLNRVMCFFECVYGTPRNSYIWDKEDFGGILDRFNAYLGEIFEIWRERDGDGDTSQNKASKKTPLDEMAGFPFPSTTAISTFENPVKMGTGSNRKPTGPHSPYFGLQPPPEVVPRPPPRPAPSAQPASSQVPNRSAPSQMSPPPYSRIPKASPSAKRPPAKERARHAEKQKQKASAMQIDSRDTGEAIPIPESRYTTHVPQPHSRSQIQSSPSASTTTTATAAAATPPPTQPPHQTSPSEKPSSLHPNWLLLPSSSLHQRLTLTLTLSPSSQEKALIWDLACLFCLTCILTTSSPPSPHKYMTHLSDIIADANLHASENNSNMMWLIQTNDASVEHSARMWDVAAWTWVCKHLNGRVRERLRGWVWGFLTGEKCKGKERLGGWDFSYDA